MSIFINTDLFLNNGTKSSSKMATELFESPNTVVLDTPLTIWRPPIFLLSSLNPTVSALSESAFQISITIPVIFPFWSDVVSISRFFLLASRAVTSRPNLATARVYTPTLQPRSKNTKRGSFWSMLSTFCMFPTSQFPLAIIVLETWISIAGS